MNEWDSSVIPLHGNKAKPIPSPSQQNHDDFDEENDEFSPLGGVGMPGHEHLVRGLENIRAKKRRRRCGAGFTVSLSESYGDRIKNKRCLSVGRWLESKPVQAVILTLFLLDVAIVLTEVCL